MYIQFLKLIINNTQLGQRRLRNSCIKEKKVFHAVQNWKIEIVHILNLTN